MSKLFGVNISQIVADNIGPGILPAVLTKVTPGLRWAGALTAGLNPTSMNKTCRGLATAYSDYAVANDLAQVSDRKIMLLGDTIQDGAVPEPGDLITIADKGVQTTFVITGPVDADPAAATYTCRGVKT